MLGTLMDANFHYNQELGEMSSLYLKVGRCLFILGTLFEYLPYQHGITMTLCRSNSKKVLSRNGYKSNGAQTFSG